PGWVGESQRARERREQRVAAQVEPVRPQGGQAVAGRELRPRVAPLGGGGAAGEGSVADHGQVLAALADVHRERDHVGACLLGDPADGNRCVQAARIGEHYTFCHDIPLVLVAPGFPALLTVLLPAVPMAGVTAAPPAVPPAVAAPAPRALPRPDPG